MNTRLRIRHAPWSLCVLATATCLASCSSSDEPASDEPVGSQSSALACTAAVSKYLGNYPSDRETNWTQDIQGVAHDDDHWFFTQRTRMWKFHVSFDLNQNAPPGTLSVGIPAHLTADYDHFGDPDVLWGYVFVPLEQKSGHRVPPRIVAFRASDLSYVSDAPLPQQTRSGWVAVNEQDGWLYTSHDSISSTHKLKRYFLDWWALQQSSQLVLYGPEELSVTGIDGAPLALGDYMQGGDFSDDGCTLYLVNGMEYALAPTAGIHVIDTATWHEYKRSDKHKGTFRYEFYSDYRQQEPEGLTYWKLGPGVAPRVPESALHVILAGMIGDTSLWLKHYR